MSKTTLWIDGFNPSYDDAPYNVGDVFFLIEHSNPIRHTESADLALTPPRTNQSNEYRVHGWCGSWNNNNTYGSGIVQVVRIAKNGRVQVRRLTRSDEDCDFVLINNADEALVEKFIEENGFEEEFSWSLA